RPGLVVPGPPRKPIISSGPRRKPNLPAGTSWARRLIEATSNQGTLGGVCPLAAGGAIAVQIKSCRIGRLAGNFEVSPSPSLSCAFDPDPRRDWPVYPQLSTVRPQLDFVAGRHHVDPHSRADALTIEKFEQLAVALVDAGDSEVLAGSRLFERLESATAPQAG